MSLTSQFGAPGQSQAIFSTSEEILWGGDVTRIPILQRQVVIDGTARDEGNLQSPVLRQGLLMGRVTATGKLKEYNPAAADGSEVVYGVLGIEILTQDVLSNVDRDAVAPVVVLGPIRASKMLIQGQPMVGNADEVAARASLNRRGAFFLDDEF